MAWGARAFPFKRDSATRSILLESGANIKAVSSLLGHSSVSITLDTYGHVLPGMDGILGVEDIESQQRRSMG